MKGKLEPWLLYNEENKPTVGQVYVVESVEEDVWDADNECVVVLAHLRLFTAAALPLTVFAANEEVSSGQLD